MTLVDLKAFELVGRLYHEHLLLPGWRRWPNAEHDPWEGIGVFLSGYAFERQGRPARFAPTAIEVIQEMQASGRGVQEDVAQEAWDRFSGKLGGQNLNHANNPMAPKGTPFTRKAHALRTAGPSVFELAREWAPSIVGHTLSLIRGQGIRDAHRRLASINGVGPKITSFFLRDVALRFELAPGADRALLQPVDVWVQRAAYCLWSSGTEDSLDVAGRIVRECDLEGVNPELVNAGMWYFAAQIARSDRVFDSAIHDPGEFHRLLVAYVEGLKSAVSAYEQAYRPC